MQINSTVQSKLKLLYDKTTILWIERNTNEENIIVGEKLLLSRFDRDQGTPINFNGKLEPFWQKKFSSFGKKWSLERQIYRLIYNAMRMFFISFNGMRIYKVSSINENINVYSHVDFASSFLAHMYDSGKKVIDLFTELKLNKYNTSFIKKFSETRNKLFEHGHNPKNLDCLILEPNFWHIVATSSFLPINIHTNQEQEFVGFIDYYQDYYDLENIFSKIVSGF